MSTSPERGIDPQTTPVNSMTYREPPTFDTTAERLRWRADRIGPFGLDYISAGELRRIADELDGQTDA